MENVRLNSLLASSCYMMGVLNQEVELSSNVYNAVSVDSTLVLQVSVKSKVTNDE